MYRLKVPHIVAGAQGNPAKNLLEGLQYVGKNSIFSFLIGMTFFNSLFGMAYVMLMPVFAVDILEVGARGQGFLLGLGGAGSLLATIWLSSRGNTRYKGFLIIGGAVLFGLALATFAVTSSLLGFYSLALFLMFLMGIFNSTYMISIQSSLQMLVPDQMRGRVMGFYGMTWSIMPLSGMQEFYRDILCGNDWGTGGSCLCPGSSSPEQQSAQPGYHAESTRARGYRHRSEPAANSLTPKPEAPLEPFITKYGGAPHQL